MKLLFALRVPLILTCAIAATPTGAAPLERIGFASCVEQGKPQPIWSAVNAARPEIFVMLGDNIYGDTRNMSILQQKYDLLGAEPEFQKLRRNARLLATWDDHDYGQNDAGADYPRKQESQRIFMDFFNLPADAAMRSREGVYNAEIVGPPGQRVQFILLDTRYFRSPLISEQIPGSTRRRYGPNPDPASTILGAEQWAWLEKQLRQPAELRLLFSSIQVLSEDHGSEKWMNFPHERERLFRLLRETQATGVICFSGDRHLAELSVMDAGLGFPLYDLTSSGLNKAYTKGFRPPEINRHRVAVMNTGNNFGMIRIDWQAPDPEIRLEILDEQGDIRICQKIRRSWIAPGKAD